MALMFAETVHIKKAVSIINGLNTAKFPLLLTRVVQKLHLKDEHAFSEDEAVKLLSAFGLDQEELDLVIKTCEFFLHQAAYHAVKPALLQSQLSQLNLDEDKVEAVIEIWQTNAKEVIEELRRRQLAPNQLESVGWNLNLTMASSNQTKQKTPNAVLELGIKKDSTTNEKIHIEFSHEELYKFYDQLETIQSQIDSLS